MPLVSVASHVELIPSQVEIDPSAAQVDVGGILAGRVTHMPISSALRPQLAHIPSGRRSALASQPAPDSA